MRYFLMEQDTRIPHDIIINNLHSIRCYSAALEGHPEELPPVSVAFVTSSELNFYSDFLSRQLIMISESMKAMLDSFLPKLDYRVCCLLDNVLDRQHYYYIPVLPLCECLETKSNQVFFQTNYRHASHLCYAKSGENLYCVVSQVIAEAILRRKLQGVYFTPIQAL